MRVFVTDFSSFFFFFLADVARRFVVDRGGNVFVLPAKGLPAGHSSVVRRGAFGATPDVALADAMAHELGVTAERPAETSAFFAPAAGPLRRARLGVLLALEGLAADAVPALLALHPDAAAAPLVETSAAQDELALLASCATGRPVAQHGVVGAAFHASDGSLRAGGLARRAPALADRLGPGATVFVAAGSEQAARALGPLAPGLRAEVLSWSGPLGRWVAHAGTASAAPERGWPRLTAVLGLRLEQEGRVARLEGAAFELARPAHLALLAQLELLLERALAWRAPSADAPPSLFAFAVTGLAGLEPAVAAAAGRAAQRAAAAALAALERTAGLGEVAWQVLLLDQRAPLAALEASLAQAALLAPRALRVYGRDAYAADAAVCAELNRLLWRSDLVAVCRAALPLSRGLRAVAPAVVGNGTAPDEGISPQEVVAFQLVFWLGVVLFVVLLAGASLISSIDIPSDSPLLRNLPDIYKNTMNLRELA